MTATARNLDGLTRERLIEFANSRADDGERESLIDLAGKWKHGWIPLDAIAAAIKAKQMKGDGIRRSGASSGAVRSAGKTRFDPKGAAAHSALTSGVRGKARPPARAGVTQSKVEAQKASAHATSLYDRHIGSRSEQSATREQLREVARAHEAADAAHHAAGSPSSAEWHRTEANRLHGVAAEKAPARSKGVPGIDDRPPGTPAEARRAAALGHPDTSRTSPISKEIKVRKETKDGRVSFVAEHSNGVNTVSVRIPQRQGTTDHQHRLAAREALLKGIARDHPGRKAKADGGQPGGNPNAATVAVPINQLQQYPDRELRNWLTRGDASMKQRAQAELDRRAAAKAAGSPRRGLNNYSPGRVEKPAPTIGELNGNVNAATLTSYESYSTGDAEKARDKARAMAADTGRNEQTRANAAQLAHYLDRMLEKRAGQGKAEPSDSATFGGETFKVGDRVKFKERVSGVGLRQQKGEILAHHGNGSFTIRKDDGTEVRRIIDDLGHEGKAGAAAEPAAPKVKKPRKPSALHEDYRRQREEQDRRFEAAVGGGISARDTKTQEYKDYFGVGDHSTTPQEERVTFARFLEQRRQGSEYDRRQQQAYDSGMKLGAAHGEATGDTAHHEGEYRHAEAGHDGEMFGQGYADGLIAGATRAEKKRAEEAQAKASADYEQARTAASAAGNKAVRSGQSADQSAAVHAHVAAGRAALQAGRRDDAQHHIQMAQSHKAAADTLKAREEAKAAAPPPPGTVRLEGNQSIVINGPNAGKVSDPSPAKPDTSPPAAAGITVEHSGDGTVVHGTSRDDRETIDALKAQGFKWSRNLNGWYLPRSWGESTRDVRVRGLQARLGDKVTVQRGNLARSGSGTEQRQARIDRANDLAATHEAQAGKAQAEADRRFQASHDATAGIPFGQPILVGHHSQRRHERALEKSHSNMRAGVDALAQAEQSRHRAGEAAARARLEADPKFLARRLDRNQAEHRKVLRSLEGANPADEHTQQLEALRQDLEAKISADQAASAAAGGGQHSKATITAGDVIVYRGTPRMVTRTNAKSVTVPHWEPRLAEGGYTDTIPYSQIDRHHRLENARPDTLRKYLDAPNIPAAVKSRIRAILRDRGEA